MSWPMKLAPEGGKRGACSNCGDSATVDQVLTSVAVGGQSVCVCDRCKTLPKYAKNLK